jgi:chromosome segregation ATPase
VPDLIGMFFSALTAGGLAVAIVKAIDRWNARKTRASSDAVKATAQARKAEAETTGKIQVAKIEAEKTAVDRLIDQLGKQLENLSHRLDEERDDCARELASMREEYHARIGELTDQVQGLSLKHEACERRVNAVVADNGRLRDQIARLVANGRG